MAGHKHAALMAEYAKDAAETDRPWERWQWSESPDSGEWIDCKVYEDAPIWYVSCGYRRKPRTLTIGSVEIEAPLKSITQGQDVWSWDAVGFVIQAKPATFDNQFWSHAVANGRAFTTPEAAKATYNAITALLTGKDAA